MEIQTTLNLKSSYWQRYNRSQTQEKTIFIRLLKELTECLPNRYRGFGENRRCINLAHIIFCLCVKNYVIKSARRTIAELETYKNLKYIDKVPHFNTLLIYLRDPRLRPILEDLIRFSALPLKDIENKFCCDATGFGISVLNDRWSQIRQKFNKHHKYYKAHICFGVFTNIVTSCKITEGTSHDAPHLPELVNETAKNFRMIECSADKGYLSRENLKVIWDNGCLPLIPFKDMNKGKRGHGIVWNSMYKFFKENREEFMKKYHLRSNAESGMFMIKQRFGDLSMMKHDVSVKNDVLVKILCHNLCVLAQEICLLDLDFSFAQLLNQVA